MLLAFCGSNFSNPPLLSAGPVVELAWSSANSDARAPGIAESEKRKSDGWKGILVVGQVGTTIADGWEPLPLSGLPLDLRPVKPLQRGQVGSSDHSSQSTGCSCGW
jgi:hypothetical protein